MLKKLFSLLAPAFLITCSAHASQDPKSFNAEEIMRMQTQHVLDICQQKPENKHCEQIRSILNHFQNPPKSKLAVIKGPFLPTDHARAILHFQTQDLGKIMGWDEDRIMQETTLLHTALEKILAEPRQQQKK